MAYLSWDEWQKQNPAPFDVAAFKKAGDAQYAGMLYEQRPQEWRDEYQRQLDANNQWQADYHNQVGAGGGRISDLAGITNDKVNVWDGAQGAYAPRGGPATRTQGEIDSGAGMVGDTGKGSTYNSPAAGIVNGVARPPATAQLLNLLSRFRAPQRGMLTGAPYYQPPPALGANRGYGAYQGSLYGSRPPGLRAPVQNPAIQQLLMAIFGGR